MELIAHRGDTTHAPENTFAAYDAALAIGADGVEIDVRLSADGVPVVYHYYGLSVNTALPGGVFRYTHDELTRVRISGADGVRHAIPVLSEVLARYAGRMALEIEIKGPEPESAAAAGAALREVRAAWDSIEVTSFEPALLHAIQRECPGIATDLLLPKSEPWMTEEIVTYNALQRGRLARARAVHLHPTQLTAHMVETLRHGGLEVHAWDVNDCAALAHVAALGVPRACTDRVALLRACVGD